MKITRVIRKKELNYDRDYACENGHAKVYDIGGCSLEWSVFGYEAEGTHEEILAVARYYKKKGYVVIPGTSQNVTTVYVNHRLMMVHLG